MSIEVERKALLTLSEYERLPSMILSLGGEDLGPDDTESLFYLIDNAQIKLQLRPATNQAKIAWKSDGFDKEARSRLEIEVGIIPDDYDQAENFMSALFPNVKKIPTTQKRHNYRISDITIALKYSEHWQYHMEIDKVIDTENEVDSAVNDIEHVAKRLDVKILTLREETEFVAKVLSKL